MKYNARAVSEGGGEARAAPSTTSTRERARLDGGRSATAPRANAGADDIPTMQTPEEQAIAQVTAPPATAAAPGVAPPSSSILSTPLPPIDAVPLPNQPLPAAQAKQRTPAEQAELDAELDALHAELGVQRGNALAEAMKPKLEVPMPFQAATAMPRPPASVATAPTMAAATAPTAQPPAQAPPPPPVPISDAAPIAPPSEQLLALPAPEDVNSLITLDVSTGQAVTLDHLGPVVVNSDGTLARITNWNQMSEQERNVTKRRIAKRNIERLQAFRDRGELKDDLVSALGSSAS